MASIDDQNISSATAIAICMVIVVVSIAVLSKFGVI